MATDEIDTKRYDRQIRLWGMETQLRMGSTRVLLCGAGGLTAEVAKNLVLSGVGHVTLQDHEAVTEADVGTGGQFLLSSSDVGRNRAEASLAFLRELNPSVTVASEPRDVRTLGSDHLAQFDVVVATELELADILRLGMTARAARTAPTPAAQADGPSGAKRQRVAEPSAHAQPDGGGATAGKKPVYFFGAGASGLYGYALLDLGEYAYTETTTKKLADGESTSTTQPKSISYPAVENALAGATSVKQPADIARVLAAQRAHYGKQAVDTAVAHTLEQLALPPSTLTKEDVEVVRANASPALSPTCAILGGLIGQEVIKLISGKDTPINNFLCLDCVSAPPQGGGRVVRLAPAH